jgi:hypothetical protein
VKKDEFGVSGGFGRGDKPLKRLILVSDRIHRAEATVLMRLARRDLDACACRKKLESEQACLL